jgi:hypothetical protein
METESRKPWTAPRVITSAIRHTEAHVSINPPDGSTPIYGPYGT